MSGASPLAAQSPSAMRSLKPTEVAPGGTVVVTITVSDLTGNLGRVTETLPPGFAYDSSSLNAAQVSTSGQDVTFTLLGQASFTYNVTASSSVGTNNPFSGVLNPGNITVSGGDNVEVSASAPPPTDPDPDPTPPGTSITVNDAVGDVKLYLSVTGQNDSDTPARKDIPLGGADGVFEGGDGHKGIHSLDN